MLFLQDASYTHPNRDLLFKDINLAINKHDKIALIGNNGSGKSTLLQILAGTLLPSHGLARTESDPYYVPQIFGQFNDHTIAQALKIDDKIAALKQILNGHVTDENLTLLADDWNIEERCHEAFEKWNLNIPDLNQKMGNAERRAKNEGFLAGIMIHNPEIVLLDEPSNHLDSVSRGILYDYIKSTTAHIGSSESRQNIAEPAEYCL
jgi:ATPase subunit of ABC transporter with duplicated ATPase domains